MSSNQATVFLEVAKLAHLLRWFGDPILRTECQELSIDEINSPTTQELAQKLADVLMQVRQITGMGRGLAAPQIGIAKRMVAIFLEKEVQILINPKITQASNEAGIYPEMCLSGLPMKANVIRPWKVGVEYLDIHNQSHGLTADPMLSRLLQHEIDHLDGILFVDKADVKSIGFVSSFEEYKTQAKLIQL